MMRAEAKEEFKQRLLQVRVYTHSIGIKTLPRDNSQRSCMLGVLELRKSPRVAISSNTSRRSARRNIIADHEKSHRGLDREISLSENAIFALNTSIARQV
jgi:hypothetical protein